MPGRLNGMTGRLVSHADLTEHPTGFTVRPNSGKLACRQEQEL
jgi:hypothetical protein